MLLFAEKLRLILFLRKLHQRFVQFLFCCYFSCMVLYIRLLKESILFALNALVANKLRTLLSLLGITVGIFAIISVFTVVDSLEKQIRNSIRSLGDNVIYIQKWPWEFGGEFQWWKYWQRPQPKISELDALLNRSEKIEKAAFICGSMSSLSSVEENLENTEWWGVSHQFPDVSTFEVDRGRYFSEFESKNGRQVIVLGDKIAETIFPSGNAIGREVKILGRKFEVIGISKKQGESIMGSNDNRVYLPINYVKTLMNVSSDQTNPSIVVKSKDGISNQELKDELAGIMRSLRRLSPKTDDNFALNESTLLTQGFTPLFAIVNMAGGVIGFFSILVGGFGIANIMFVTVKERTPIIGIQKSLGAKNDFILFQFLSEAIILSLIGGIIGLLLIFILVFISGFLIDFEFSLSFANIIIGLSISIVTGLVSGILPAISASRLNPVEAIRANG